MEEDYRDAHFNRPRPNARRSRGCRGPGWRPGLPRLPAELEYRIVSSELVLIDVHAGLIVDILPLPAS